MSQRAAQILRDLQGLNIPGKVAAAIHEKVEPVMGKPMAEAAPKATTKVKKDADPSTGKSWHKVAFSRDNYLKDVRSNLLGTMVLSIFGCCLVLGAASVGSMSYLMPQLAELQQQSETIQRLPADLKSVSDQIQAQTARRQNLVAEQEKLVKFFPNPHQTYGTYGNFLMLLDEHKLRVTSQKGGITQTSANPLLADAASQAEMLKKAQQAAAANPKAPPAPAAPKLNMLSGDIKPGLNYYHLAFTLEGSYVGYLAARQALVNENPNLVVHSESVTSLKEGANALSISTYVSIPFIEKP
jgi:hypothetical protein